MPDLLMEKDGPVVVLTTEPAGQAERHDAGDVRPPG